MKSSDNNLTSLIDYADSLVDFSDLRNAVIKYCIQFTELMLVFDPPQEIAQQILSLTDQILENPKAVLMLHERLKSLFDLLKSQLKILKEASNEEYTNTTLDILQTIQTMQDIVVANNFSNAPLAQPITLMSDSDANMMNSDILMQSITVAPEPKVTSVARSNKFTNEQNQGTSSSARSNNVRSAALDYLNAEEIQEIQDMIASDILMQLKNVVLEPNVTSATRSNTFTSKQPQKTSSSADHSTDYINRLAQNTPDILVRESLIQPVTLPDSRVTLNEFTNAQPQEALFFNYTSMPSTTTDHINRLTELLNIFDMPLEIENQINHLICIMPRTKIEIPSHQIELHLTLLACKLDLLNHEDFTESTHEISTNINTIMQTMFGLLEMD